MSRNKQRGFIMSMANYYKNKINFHKQEKSRAEILKKRDEAREHTKDIENYQELKKVLCNE